MINIRIMDYNTCYQLCIQRRLFITKMFHKESCHKDCKHLFKKTTSIKDGKMARHSTKKRKTATG